ncbi:MAG: site-2 protease family protein [Acidobacteria bacterium]|nr:site-2 protease family protein [Acidobacteriota bacterium]
MSERYLAPAQTIEPPLVERKRNSDVTPWRLVLHAGLLVLTLVSCFFTGALMALPSGPASEQILQDPKLGATGEPGWLAFIFAALRDPHLASSGLAYAFTLIAILLAHEMGHYLACRYYGVRSSLPYFIPAPTFIGTFGAFIRIKEPITSRRALFDIGIAGPLAGFAVAVPAAMVGLLLAEPAAPLPPTGNTIVFQDPLFFIGIQHLFDLPRMMEWNPIYFAAWVGMLATSLNLLPVGQLDGGHVVYAILGRRGHRAVAVSMFALICILAVLTYWIHRWPGWFIYAALLGLMLGLKHPPLVDEYVPIDRTRRIIGVVGLLVFALSFMPFPIVIE